MKRTAAEATSPEAIGEPVGPATKAPKMPIRLRDQIEGLETLYGAVTRPRDSIWQRMFNLIDRVFPEAAIFLNWDSPLRSREIADDSRVSLDDLGESTSEESSED